MLILALVGLALLLSWLTGGRPERLAQLSLRYAYLAPLAFGLQLLVFSSFWQERIGQVALARALYLVSLLLLVVLVWSNRRVPGLLLLGTGLLLNASVILANGGKMPASLAALQRAGLVASRAEFELAQVTNSALMDAATPLWFLGDVFAVPHSWPLANVFSAGDVLIALGAAWFVWANLRSAPSSLTLPACYAERNEES